jgi:hypothetical protein
VPAVANSATVMAIMVVVRVLRSKLNGVFMGGFPV